MVIVDVLDGSISILFKLYCVSKQGEIVKDREQKTTFSPKQL